MKIILHIGMPKTGSTALQATLTNARAELLRHGVLYPAVDSHPTNHNFLALLLREGAFLPRHYKYLYGDQPDLLRKVFEKNWAQVKQQISQYKPHTVVLSGEYMFRGLLVGEPEAFRAHLHELSDDIHAVAYIRQPSKHYLSGLQQNLKSSGKFKFPKPLNLRKPLESCEVLFGRKPEVVLFERDMLFGQDITKDFLHRVDSELLPIFSEMASPVINESLSAESMSILQDYGDVNHPDSTNNYKEDCSRMQKLLQQIEKHHGLESRPVINSELSSIIDHASTDLLWLKEKCGIILKDVDYTRIKAVQNDVFRSFCKVTDVCAVDADQKKKILMLASSALLAQQSKLSSRLSKKLQRNAGKRILQRIRTGLNRFGCKGPVTK